MYIVQHLRQQIINYTRQTDMSSDPTETGLHQQRTYAAYEAMSFSDSWTRKVKAHKTKVLQMHVASDMQLWWEIIIIIIIVFVFF